MEIVSSPKIDNSSIAENSDIQERVGRGHDVQICLIIARGYRGEGTDQTQGDRDQKLGKSCHHVYGNLNASQCPMMPIELTMHIYKIDRVLNR